MPNIAAIHTSPAALGPVGSYYAAHAPELRITNLLDDGLLRLFGTDAADQVQERLTELIRSAKRWYAADAALVTCSSVDTATLHALRAAAGIPVVKIDQPMARKAVEGGGRIGVAVTFPPTVRPTTQLLEAAAAEAGTRPEISVRIAEGAYDALLGGDAERHDQLLIQTVRELERDGADTIVLAQVSMARALPALERAVGVPVLSALETSLAAIRSELPVA